MRTNKESKENAWGKLLERSFPHTPFKNFEQKERSSDQLKSPPFRTHETAGFL
jgi:hypothetical protein